MAETIEIGGIQIEVERKDIKNVHLNVLPPLGDVRVSVPHSAATASVRAFLASKLPWIRQQQKKYMEQEREAPRELQDKESHFVWGERCLLKVEENALADGILVQHKTLVIRAKRGVDHSSKQEMLGKWYREQVKSEVIPLITKWEELLGVKVEGLFVQQMKTRWGSCNTDSMTIRLNSELAKKPREFLEYVLVHEMVHLIERGHGERFVATMDRVLPKWRFFREELNRLPLVEI